MAEDLAAGFGDSPAAGVRDFGDEAADREAFPEAADGSAGSAGRLCRGGPFEDTPEVFVAEAVGDVVAVQDGGEQVEIAAAGGIEARRASGRGLASVPRGWPVRDERGPGRRRG